MSAATSHRRLLLAGAAAVYAGVLAASALWERPGLGVAHCYYVAIALVALATGPRRGVLAGFLATGLWALGVLLNPAVPPAEDRKSTRLNSSHSQNSYAAFCLK